MLTSPIFYMAAIQTVVTLTFLVLWIENRSKCHLLWWAIAHFLLSVLTVAVHKFGLPTPSSSWLYLAVFNCCHSATSVSFIVAASLYKNLSVPLKYFLFSGVAYTAFILAFSVYLGSVGAVLIAVTVLSAAFLFTAWAFWGSGYLALITAFVFGFRAINALYIIFFITDGELLKNTGTMSYMLVLTTLISAMLLLLNVVHRNRLELESHIRFLSLTQAISEDLQGISNQQQASKAIIKLLLKYQVWANVAVFIPDHDEKILDLVAADGTHLTPELESMLGEGLPINDSVAGETFLSQQLICQYDAFGARGIAKYGSRLGPVDQEMTLVTVPLVRGDNVYGVLVANRGIKGRLLPEESKILENIGRVMGFAFANIKQLAELSYNATHDTLTGLRNRVALHAYFKQQPPGKRFVLMLFDLNHFKEVNDTLGHSVGDSMLCALAKRLQNELENDAITVFRLGGDEFIVTYDISPNCPLKEDLAQQLTALISTVIHVDDLALRSSAAIGVVDSYGNALDSHELLRCADLAMYQAKSQGAPIAYYEKTSDYDVQRRANILAGIAAAIDNDQLVLAYQPIINLQEKRCYKCEALVRWYHPEQGIIEAVSFMPIIEATQMILKIARIVIAAAIKDAKAWQLQGQEMTVSINLSVRNLMDSDLVKFLVAQVQHYSLDPAYIQLEITETMLMSDRYAAEQVLNQLVEAGFSIALDDFGTGYSSLAYLPNLPIDTLKIDSSFTAKMLIDTGTKSVVESTVELSRKLGFSVVAEGVENTRQAEIYEQMGCQYAQGFLYAKPLPQVEFGQWLVDYNSETETLS